jgi:Tol biopolymer transport system component
MIGRTLSHYQITAKLGEGGMGEVWRATDTSLNREVAVKVLPAEMAADPERLERFKREAQAIAALNHPNIVTIYSVEEAEGLHLLTMELVEGESLDQVLPANGFGLDRLFTLAIQIADALAAAHEKGITHRDLKPANVMVTEGDRISVLDFGLAKLAEAEDENAETQLMTQAGMILGTVPYMSPEQVQARPVDHRSDIFSLGILLYEMACGKRPFGGENAASVISAVLKDQPPSVTQLRAELPNHLSRIVRRCLEKQPQRRYQSARDIQLELEGLESEMKRAASFSGSAASTIQAADAEPKGGVPAPATTRRRLVGRWIGVSVAAAIVGGLAGVGIYTTLTDRAPAPSPSLHTEISLPDDASLGFGLAALGVDSNLLALSPDGTLLVYVGSSPGGGSQLYRRDLTGFDPPVAIPGTEGAHHAFFSPDGRALGFVTAEKLKRVAPNGDSLQTIAPIAQVIRGQWTADDTIYLGADEGRRLQRVPAGGGRLEDLHLNRDMVFLEVLPHGRSALVILGNWINTDYADIALLDLKTFQIRKILEGGYDARMMPSGRLVFARGGSLLAVPFDVEAGRITDEPVTVMREVVMDAIIGQAQFAVSDSGTMVFARGPELARGGVARIDRDGNQEFLSVPQGAYGVLDLDPTGRKLVIEVADVESYVWVYDIPDERGTRLPGRRTGSPVWSSDGEMIGYSDSSNQTLRIESLGSTAAVRPTIQNEWSARISSWSPDDRVIAIDGQNQGLFQIGFLDLEDGSIAWVDSGGNHQWGAAFSPDGKWVAYSSSETGFWEIWVRSYPDGSVVRQISDGGGLETVWSPSGEIFYRRGDRWMSVAITTEPTLSWSAPSQVFETDFIDTPGRSFDVSSDGQSLYVLKQPNPPDGTRVHVVTGWAPRS